MRKFNTTVCLLLLALVGCSKTATETADQPVSTISGSGQQMVTLKLPGMT